MSRIARKNYNASFFHIMIQGINREYIYNKPRYKKKYLNLIEKYEKDFKIEVLAYCIMNNHVHLLIYTKDIKEMSKFMHMINTLYAKYYNYMENQRVGYVYRERYKSEPICNKIYFIKCINYIHFNPVKASIVKNCKDYKYSSYNYYINNINNKEDKKINRIKEVLQDNNYIEILKNYTNNIELFEEIDEKDKMKQIIENKIITFLQQENRRIEDIFEDIILLKKLILSLINVGYKIKKKDISNTLKISKSKLFEIIKY